MTGAFPTDPVPPQPDRTGCRRRVNDFYAHTRSLPARGIASQTITCHGRPYDRGGRVWCGSLPGGWWWSVEFETSQVALGSQQYPGNHGVPVAYTAR
ncbi:hypothetical protein GCM10010319_34780 [Streptomyces blastmyceticus]|uniref:Uncharacterized protein n=1 Tax=Streptomyces blastmyceticus TaxID=68180 RepID=A0ABN0X457_9ACTN